ncbi:MAG: efflux RND transporter permease subunit [Candidatus Anammoxibacter sp.]
MHGLIDWFARNSVAANILMVMVLFLGGYALMNQVTLEVFPEFETNVITITVPYRGSTPTEVEEGVAIHIEEAIYDLIGIEKISSTSSEGSASISIEVEDRHSPRELLDDVKNRVDAINTFPDEIERPLYKIEQRRREAISVVVSGDLPEQELRHLGEKVRDDLTNLPGITQVELTAVRPYEISIEVSEHNLRKYHLSFDMISNAISQSSLDLPAGKIRTKGGETLLHTKGQAYIKEDFEKITIRTQENGAKLSLSDIATINDGFEEESLFALFNNTPCVVINVYRVGSQNAMELAGTVRDYVASEHMPQGVTLSYWRDRSVIIKNRLTTLIKNAIQGGILVIILLALFLRLRVAIWVCVGIPVSFMGAIFMMPILGVTINIVSLFAFILVLGIVVDDAIVTGENIYTHINRSNEGVISAIRGTQEVSIPVFFGMMTTAIAFVPIMLLGGRFGPIFAHIPLVIIPVLIFSLIESKLVLPSHLKHMKADNKSGSGWLFRIQRRVSKGLEYVIANYYRPTLEPAMRHRYITLSIFIAIFIITMSIVISGHLRFSFFPRVQSELARATLTMPQGTSFAVTSAHIRHISDAARQLKNKHIDESTGESVIKNILVMGGTTGSESPQSHIGRVSFEIVPPEERTNPVTSTDLVREWRKMIGPLAGVKELNFRAEIGRIGSPIDIQLAGQNFDELQIISEKLKVRLSQYPGVFDITDTFESGKDEIQLNIKPEARYLNITQLDLARQVRQAFFGEEVQRIQRGRDDVRVMLRYPADERKSIEDLKRMYIRTSDGSEVPFMHVANVKIGRGFSSIRRVDRRRIISITADINKDTVDMRNITADLREFLDELVQSYSGVSYSFEGEAKEQRKSFGGLFSGLLYVLLGIYVLLAIPFKSYFQPLIVMSIIPFGVIGAILGHLIAGISLSILSLFGMLALSGIVVNDSLVLVDYVNKQIRAGMPLLEAIKTSGTARFRPILLTSLTTFVGLMPLIFEKSTQAQFLIPMAVSLAYGILFATFITLYLIPINYLILEDIVIILNKAKSFITGNSTRKI